MKELGSGNGKKTKEYCIYGYKIPGVVHNMLLNTYKAKGSTLDHTTPTSQNNLLTN